MKKYLYNTLSVLRLHEKANNAFKTEYAGTIIMQYLENYGEYNEDKERYNFASLEVALRNIVPPCSGGEWVKQYTLIADDIADMYHSRVLNPMGEYGGEYDEM